MTTALVVIDMQTALVVDAYEASDILARVAVLIGEARAKGAPVIYVQHNHASFEPLMKGNPGWQIAAQLELRAGDVVIEKEASDAFHGTRLAELLRERGATELVVCGMMTEYCVDTTARSALSQGFDVILASDAHTTGDSHVAAREIIAHHNAVLPNVVHPTCRIIALPHSEIGFT